jgi:hypothetical protein
MQRRAREVTRPDQARVKWRRGRLRQYGLTPWGFHRLLKYQGGRCAICRSSDAGPNHNWQIDHDPGTGAVRGLLCLTCNTGIGGLRHNVNTLRAAIVYLLAENDFREIRPLPLDFGDGPGVWP